MNALPVIERELRVQARSQTTFVVRVCGVILLLPTGWGYFSAYGSNPVNGAALFSWLNLALFCAIWILTPLLVADCISREKREGTLGLLFLTPLKSGEIVLAKSLIHGLRALTIWLAVLPILIVPVLMGGVGWKEAALSMLFNFSSIAWALAAGLIASALGKAWSRSVLLAGLIALIALLVFSYLTGLGLLNVMVRLPGWGKLPALSQVSLERLVAAGFFLVTDFDQSWQSHLGVMPSGGQTAMLVVAVLGATTSLLMLGSAIPLAAWIMRRSWRELPPQAWQIRCEKVLLTPMVGVSFLKRWQQRRLARNPIGWLERRTWSGRMTTWGWFAAAAFLSVFLVEDGPVIRFRGEQQWAFWLLLGSVAASSAGSFRRERETGVLELLLVSPASEHQIIWGRLTGIWSQFLPALVWLGAVWFFCAAIFHIDEITGPLWFFATAFLTLPIIGLYFSLHRNNYIGAILLTLLLGLAVPVGVLQILIVTTKGFFPGKTEALVVTQLLIGVLVERRLYSDLLRRNFAFDRSAA